MRFLSVTSLCVLLGIQASMMEASESWMQVLSTPEPINIASVKLLPYDWGSLAGKQYTLATHEEFHGDGQDVTIRDITFEYRIVDCDKDNENWTLSVKSKIMISGSVKAQNIERELDKAVYQGEFKLVVDDAGRLNHIHRNIQRSPDENHDEVQIAESAIASFADYLVMPLPPKNTSGFYWDNAVDGSEREALGLGRREADTLWSIVKDDTTNVYFYGQEQMIQRSDPKLSERGALGFTNKVFVWVYDKSRNTLVSGEFRVVRYGLNRTSSTHGKFVLEEAK